jgi:hypothetical protein
MDCVTMPGFTAGAVFEAAGRYYASRLRMAPDGEGDIRPQLKIREGGECPVPICSSGDGLEDCCCSKPGQLCVISMHYCYCTYDEPFSSRRNASIMKSSIEMR